MRFAKPRESASTVATRRQARAEYLQALGQAERPSLPSPTLPERLRCCELAQHVPCFCGGARLCPVHGLACYGPHSHD